MDIVNKYKQFGFSRFTKNLCAALDKNKGDIKGFVKQVESVVVGRVNRKKAFREGEVKLTKVPGEEIGKVKEVSPEGKYTEESIERKFKESGRKPLEIFSEEELRADKALFERSLTSIQDYLKEHQKDVNNHDKFYLQYFSARISSQLGDHKTYLKYNRDALSILKKAENTQEDWVIDLDVPSMIKLMIEEKIQKHELMEKGPLFKERARKEEEALASKVYAEAGVLSPRDNMNFFRAFRKTEFSSLILRLNALDAIENEKFGVFLLKMSTVKDTMVRGAGYYKKDTVVVTKPEHALTPEEALIKTLLHELTHRAMERVFQNASRPYPKDNIEIKNAYRESMRQVLVDTVDTLIPLEVLEKLDCNLPHTIQLSGPPPKDIPFKFKHPWTRSLSLDKLVENCFGPNGILHPRSINVYDLMGSSISLDGQAIKNEFGEVDDVTMLLAENFADLCNSLYDVFGGKYSEAELDIEFITKVSDKLLRPGFADMKAVKRLIKYFDDHVNPEMKKYVEGHPGKEKMIANNAGYLMLLDNASWFLTHKASLRMIAILVIAIIFYAYRMIINLSSG